MLSLNQESIEIILKRLNAKDIKELIARDFGTKRPSGKFGKDRFKIYAQNFRGSVRLSAGRICMPAEFRQKLRKKIVLP